MNIVNINLSISSLSGGGTAERTIQMSKALSLIGHQCTIITLNQAISEDSKIDLANVKIISFPYFSNRFFFPLISVTKMYNAIKSADIVHIMGHWTLLNAISFIFVISLKKKYVVCPAGALPIYGRSIIIKEIYNFVIGKKIIQNASACIAITSDEIQHFNNYGVPRSKVEIIPNGIYLNKFLEKDDLLFKNKYQLGDFKIILFLGRLNHIKGPDLLVNAFVSLDKNSHDYQLVIAGSDEGLLPKLTEITKKFNYEDRVHFIGHIGSIDKSLALNASKLMVIPSRLEAMSIVILEAGSVGVPVLCTNMCGLNYLSTINAALVTPASVENIKEMLQYSIESEDALQRMGNNLKAHVIDTYAWDSIVKKFETLYLQILSQGQD